MWKFCFFLGLLFGIYYYSIFMEVYFVFIVVKYWNLDVGKMGKIGNIIVLGGL